MQVEINILRSSVHLVGFISKRLYREARSTKHNKIIYLQAFAGIVIISKYSEFSPRTGHEGPEEK